MTTDPYEILGLDSTASIEDARAAYRRLVEIYHPDRYQESRPEVRDEAAQRMRDLNEAWNRIQKVRPNATGRPVDGDGESTGTPRRPSSTTPGGPRFPPPRKPAPQPARRIDPMWVAFGVGAVSFVLLIGWLAISSGDDDSSDNARTAAPASTSPPATNRTTTTTSSTTTTTEAPEPETRQTVPGPPEPSAPWATGPVAATGDLVDVVVGWNGARSFDDPWQCGLYAPTELGTQVGLVSSFLPQATRIGDFQFGWDDGAGGSMVLVSIWPADNPNVDRFFADPAPTVYADGSETRQDPAGSALLSDTLISIPGEPCHYEVSCDTTVSCSWAFESFREIVT